MTLVQIVVLALIQGITEFLPISSSAHLILVPALTGWPDQGLVVDVFYRRNERDSAALLQRHELERPEVATDFGSPWEGDIGFVPGK